MKLERKNILAIGVAVIAAALVIYSILNPPDFSGSGDEGKGSQDDQAFTADNNASTSQYILDASQTTDAQGKQLDPFSNRLYFYGYRVSKETKEKFFENAHVDAKFPEDFVFTPIDMDLEDLTGMYGHIEKMDIAVIAGRLIPNDKDILDFLHSEDTGIPNVDRSEIKISPKAIEVDPIPGNGMQKGKYWAGRAKDGKEFRVGLMPREDGKGSYLVILSGEARMVDGSDDFFDELYESFKARPAPTN